MTTIGLIIIGRNEGPRLDACLRSVSASTQASSPHAPFTLSQVVYVDSGSADDSVSIARRHDAAVVQLDPTLPFTAARARNQGAQSLLRHHPEVRYLQFLDGDTQLHPRWLAHAADYLDHNPHVAIACGRRRERAPADSIYNLLADMEWDTPVGPAQEFGGDALIRADVFSRLGGYNENFIAGEEPDFAARLRKINDPHGKPAWHIARLNHEMTRHDMAMTRFSQWWRRTARSGHALAQLAHTHGGPPLFFYRRAWRSTILWALALPALILLLALLVSHWALALFPLAYGWLLVRIARYRLRRGDDPSSAFLYAAFTLLGKFPQLLGMARFYFHLWRRRPSVLIEYKHPSPAILPANPPAAAMGNT